MLYTPIFLLIPSILSSQIDLNGRWAFSSQNGTIRGVGNVPGDIYTDLFNNNLTDPLLYGDNDMTSRWISYTNWKYSRTVQLEEADLKYRLVLQFDGLDTVSAIYWNGELLGSSNNQFVKYQFDVTQRAKIGANVIQISFESPVKYAKVQSQQFKAKYNHVIWPLCPPDMFRGECHGNMIRKVQSSFSWDWGPAFPTVGIWQSARIVRIDQAKLVDVNIRADAQNDLNFLVVIESEVVCSSDCALSIKFPELHIVTEFPAKTGQNVFNISINREKVDLWWPNGYGAQKLYEVQVGLRGDDKVVSKNVGFRSVELVQNFVNETNHAQGRNFYFKVNEVPIFLKGSNWIPVSAFPAQNNSRRFRFLLKSSQIVGMNAMRVWGGGRYEDDEFYRLADEYGILIWHDLMFACSLYPADPEFLQTVREELTHNVNRLKHHPSILIWAGNNENELGLHDGWFSGANRDVMEKEYKELYKTLAKTLIAELDPVRPYVLSSPGNGIKTDQEGGISNDPGSELYGDIHFYNEFVDLWDDASYRTPRCATEYGVQSFPSKSTVLHYLPENDYSYASEKWLHRQHHPGGTENNLIMIFSHFPIPLECSHVNSSDDLLSQCLFTNSSSFMDRYSFFSQAHQAIAYKVQTEHYRRRMNLIDSEGKGNTMCALYWQLNDIWAAPTWSSIDYDLRWKMSHYEARRFFQPLHTVLYLQKLNLLATVVNDHPIAMSVTVKMDMLSWDNGFQPVYSFNKSLTVSPSSAAELELNDKQSRVRTSLDDFVYVATILNEKGVQVGESSILIPDRLFKVSVGNFGDVRITSFSKLSTTSYEIVVSASKISPLTWLNVNIPFLGHFSDNGFTMITKTKKVILTLDEPLDLNEANLSVCNVKNCGVSVPFL